MAELTRIYEALGPSVVYLALMAGFWLGVTTLYVPGTGLPEVGTLIALVFAGLGLLVLPANTVGVLLFAAAFAFFAAYVYYRHQWALVVLGFALQIAGSLLLFRAGSGPAVAIILIANTAALFYHRLILQPGLRAQDRVSPLDPDALVGREALVEATIDPLGSVRLDGVAWSATAEDLIEAGRTVRVVGREGPYLHVEPVDTPDA